VVEVGMSFEFSVEDLKLLEAVACATEIYDPLKYAGWPRNKKLVMAPANDCTI